MSTVRAKRRYAAAVRWGHPHAGQLGQRLAEEDTATAIKKLRAFGPVREAALNRFRRLLTGQPFPDD